MEYGLPTSVGWIPDQREWRVTDRTRRWWRWRLPDQICASGRNDSADYPEHHRRGKLQGLAPGRYVGGCSRFSTHFPITRLIRIAIRFSSMRGSRRSIRRRASLRSITLFPVGPGFGQRSSHFRHDLSNAARGQHSLRVGVLDCAEGQFTFMRGQDGDPILLCDGKRIEREGHSSWGNDGAEPG